MRRWRRLRRALGSWAARPSLKGLQAEIQIATQFFNLSAQLSLIIVRHISAPTQAAVFFFKFLHATQ